VLDCVESDERVGYHEGLVAYWRGEKEGTMMLTVNLTRFLRRVKRTGRERTYSDAATTCTPSKLIWTGIFGGELRM